ncbi:probable leucine-rich repeat receptor-like protein kinase At1g68400 isoform X3 [Trifolium pratense]|uniref:probable leucine-rich repeat receptor-like protein kinase At1g68400 isoform X3 n=1 Tax=Trifolium pratense TaxID=57577 RepID=UPI001E6926D1|nr:probable leucine-rich repeat receptor-like protein kinase At1g68400 isoform X3 [Trifolium pratense]
MSSEILSNIMSLIIDITFFYIILFFLSLNIVLCIEIEINDFHPQERDGLLVLRDSLNSSINLHGNWTGPPCINNLSRWFGITCSNWHVVHITIQGVNLSGYLPSSFLQNITFLRQIDFRNNELFGTLPNLTGLVFLEEVKFSVNHFSGKIPETSLLQRFPKSSFDDNSDLCGFPLDKSCSVEPPAPPPFAIPPSPSMEENKKRLQVWIIALIVIVAAVLFLFLVIIAFLFCKRQAKGNERRRNDSTRYVFGAWAKKMVYNAGNSEDSEKLGQLEFCNKKFQVFDMDDLLRASAEVLGRGDFGVTYKATLETGNIVAVKRLSYINELNKREFIQQMQLLGEIKHENLVEIISFYHSEDQKLVIYELVSDGTLFELLHEGRGIGRIPLDWSTRLAIIKDIAKGLDFLHQYLSSHKVPHANLKSTNILIHQDNQGYHSKLIDYGFLPLLSSSKKYEEKLAISKSPEFVKGKKLTHKTDVYCFGIIMLEIITGKIPGHILGDEVEEITTNDLSDWVRTVVNNDWSTDILDLEILADREGHDAMLNLTEIALECTDMIPENRPKMSVVLRKIEEMEQIIKENE